MHFKMDVERSAGQDESARECRVLSVLMQHYTVKVAYSASCIQQLILG